jgi:HEPN domain-containing protein
MADNAYVEETADDLFINAARDILAVKALLNAAVYPSDALHIPICFHAAQAVEKQIKGFIIGNNYKARKTHNLEELLAGAVKINSDFDKIKQECVLINQFVPDVKYSNDKTITKSDINAIIKSLSTISNFPPLKSLRDSISKKYHYEIVAELTTHEETKTNSDQNAPSNRKKKQDLESSMGY